MTLGAYMTLASRIIHFIYENPGVTTLEIANGLNANVDEILSRLTQASAWTGITRYANDRDGWSYRAESACYVGKGDTSR